MLDFDDIKSAGKTVKNRARISEAIEKQDSIREKTSNWNGEKEIKEWRKKR